MSFLDRLKREADQQRLQAEQLAAERDLRETRYRSQIEPKVKALTSYLEGLVATLLEVKPPIAVRMAIQGYGDLYAIPYWDYKIEHERRHRSFSIAMTWSMKVDAERTPVVRAEGVTRVKTLTNTFRQNHLGGIKEEKRTPQGELSCATFHARGFIKARMEATISAEDPVLRLLFENASWLGASRRQVPWEQIDDNLFDRIARFLVREDDSLFTEELPDALRQKLRQEPESAGATPETVTPVVRETVQSPPAPQVAEVRQAPPVPAPPTPVPLVAATQPVAPEANTVPASAASAAMLLGDTIEIDESKLGLADFNQDNEPVNVFAPSATDRAPRAAQPTSPAVLSASVGTIPAPPPVLAGEVIPIDESKLGLLTEPTPIIIERPPAATPRTPVPVAAGSVSVPPTSRQPAPPAPVVQSAGAPVAAPPASGNSPAPAAAQPHRPDPTVKVAPAASMTSAPSVAATPPAPVTAAAASAAPGEGEVLDETKERDAALFRLRMRAMLSRLRSDDTEAGPG